MKAEARELYVYIKDRFEKELSKILIISVRKVVKKAIDRYCKDCCTNNGNLFSEEDFQEVVNKIYKEIMNNEL
ncbi:MAG: hypothetical protein PHT02_01265 [Tissierellia bacterium]|nr:hypothetical protein [Tissierellia bacterium]